MLAIDRLIPRTITSAARLSVPRTCFQTKFYPFIRSTEPRRCIETQQTDPDPSLSISRYAYGRSPRPKKRGNAAALHVRYPKVARMEQISTDKACPPLGPYTQAIRVHSQTTLYVSGQIPYDTDGKPVEGSIAEKTRACIENLSAILHEGGSALKHVVKCTVFLTDPDNFAEMNEEYERWFIHKPARSCVTVKALPKGVPVEIECVAVC